jgi:hypothetical protein
MEIDLSLASFVNPQETAAPAKGQPIGQGAVSEWTSILGFLFQIDQPMEGDVEPAINPASQPPRADVEPTEAARFWAGFLAHQSTTLVQQMVVAEPVVATGEAILPEMAEPTPESDDGLELSSSDWTILATPIPLPQQPTIAIDSPPDQPAPEPRPPTLSAPASSPHIPEGPAPAQAMAAPPAVEAVFRLQPPPPEAPPPQMPNPAPSPAIPPNPLLETRDSVMAEPESPSPAPSAAAKPLPVNSESAETRDGDRHGASSDSGREAPTEHQNNASSKEQPGFGDRHTPALPNQNQPAIRWSNTGTEALSPEQVQQSIQESTNFSIPDKRTAPLQFQLRVSPEDFGSPSTGSQNEVRLNLLQRGEDVLMKIQGGGEPLAIRAESEWEGLVERLKPHGLEAASRAFAPEFGRREGEPPAPPVQERTMSDSAANPGEEHKRFGQEQQQQHQQRQQRQRFAAKSAANAKPFSLDYIPLGPQ